jgi:transposase-like protein
LGPEISGDRRVGGATGNRSYPIRRIICITNAIEALNAKLRRAVRTHGHFPGNEAAMKLLYLALNQAADAWKRPPRDTKARWVQLNALWDNFQRLAWLEGKGAPA